MSRIANVVSAEDCFLFAINTGDFLSRHIEIAHLPINKARRDWRYHIERGIMPRYAKELHEPTSCVSKADVPAIIERLQGYYEIYIKESDPIDETAILKEISGS